MITYQGALRRVRALRSRWKEIGYELPSGFGKEACREFGFRRVWNKQLYDERNAFGVTMRPIRLDQSWIVIPKFMPIRTSSERIATILWARLNSIDIGYEMSHCALLDVKMLGGAYHIRNAIFTMKRKDVERFLIDFSAINKRRIAHHPSWYTRNHSKAFQRLVERTWPGIDKFEYDGPVYGLGRS